ncbi:MAG: branched-chain amino acid transporter permease [Atopobiaceae bacterium]
MMGIAEQAITIGLAAAGTVFTRALPFVAFGGKRQIPHWLEELGNALPGAIFALLALYCFKDVNFLAGTHGVPELIAAAAVVVLHLWKHNMLISVAGGTILYMFLVQCVFI